MWVGITIILVVWILWQFVFGYPAARVECENLTAREQYLLAKSAEAFFPEGGSLPSATEAGVVQYLDRMFAQLPKQQKILIRLLFVLIEHGPLIFGPLKGRTTRLSQEARISYFRSWEESSIYFRRLAFLSLRSLVTIGYFSSQSVETALMSEKKS